MGEAAFALQFGLRIDRSLRPAGDKGIDFWVKGASVDVKTARKAKNMIVEVGKVSADLYVLGQYYDDGVDLLGWEWGEEMSRCPSRDFGYGILNHFKEVALLHNMGEWETRGEMERGHG
tara:strand:- start:116 stop:472 length:357 start_codon:yes stop_codon:yes gene_type:complete